jgi:titin
LIVLYDYLDAKVDWLKEDKIIKQSKYFNMQSIENRHTLFILEAFPEDEGQYKCVVSNPAGHTSTSAYLKIERKIS